MFLIAGSGNRSRQLGRMEAQRCPGCGSVQGTELVKTYGYVHLFFLPVVKYDVQYFLLCPHCGAAWRLQKEDGRAMERGRLPAVDAARLTPAGNHVVSQTRFCPRCGCETSPADRFCRSCGQELR